MIDHRPYEQGDAFKMIPMKVFQPSTMIQINVDMAAQSPAAIARTIFESATGNIIGVIGFSILWPGVAEGWAILSDDIKKYSFALHRRVLNGLKTNQEHLAIRRWQISVKADYIEGNRWAESLGFVCEGLMKKFGPEGADYFLWGRT